MSRQSNLFSPVRVGPLNEPDQSTFYGGDARGYTDYPSLEAQTASV